jgi:hypothetical protein
VVKPATGNFETLLEIGSDINPRAALGDKRYDSKSNRQATRQCGICPAIPYRSNTKDMPAFFPKILAARLAWRADPGHVSPSKDGTFLPDGQITQNLSSPFAKNISLVPSGKSALPARPVLSRQEGRSRVVTNVG